MHVRLGVAGRTCVKVCVDSKGYFSWFAEFLRTMDESGVLNWLKVIYSIVRTYSFNSIVRIRFLHQSLLKKRENYTMAKGVLVELQNVPPQVVVLPRNHHHPEYSALCLDIPNQFRVAP